MKRVLIAEDDQASERALRQMVHLAEPDACIECVNNAEAATLLLAQENSAGRRFDLVISDIYLAGKLTGLDVWHLQDEFFPYTPVVLTSSMPPSEFHSAAGENAPPYFPKPFRLQDCRKVLQRYLSFS
jgi:DNA-binding NtrC family response regulator